MIQYAKRLLDWNKQYLIHNSSLNKNNIAEVFAADFIIKVNGRKYNADHDNYLKFLNNFRKTIKSISYDVQEYICENNTIIFPLVATIVRTDDDVGKYHAILLLKTNSNNLIT